MSCCVAEDAAVEPRDDPEPGARGRSGPGSAGAVLRPGQALLHHAAVLRREWQRGAEELPQHDRPEVRVPLVHARTLANRRPEYTQ